MYHVICPCCRTGESRGFAFVRYKYADEAQKAVERLDGILFFCLRFLLLFLFVILIYFIKTNMNV